MTFRLTMGTTLNDVLIYTKKNYVICRIKRSWHLDKKRGGEVPTPPTTYLVIYSYLHTTY